MWLGNHCERDVKQRLILAAQLCPHLNSAIVMVAMHPRYVCSMRSGGDRQMGKGLFPFRHLVLASTEETTRRVVQRLAPKSNPRTGKCDLAIGA